MFRFTIRELFLLTVIVAMAFGWWLDSSRTHKLNRQLQLSVAPHKKALDELALRASSDPILSTKAQELVKFNAKQVLQSVSDRMAVLQRYHELNRAAKKLPMPERSLFDKWPPEPLEVTSPAVVPEPETTAFSFRDMVWPTIAVGLAAGWCNERRKQRRTLRSDAITV